MKKIYQAFVISASLLCAGCGDFLSEYSQDMIVAKQVTDLDEVLLGEVYLASSEITKGPSSTVGGFFNMLDDDINTAHAKDLTASIRIVTWRDCISGMFGYYAWQLEVGRNYANTSTADDSSMWNALYRHINIANVILDEIEDLPHETEQDYKDYLRVKGEALFLRAHFYFTLANIYGDAYSPKDCDTKLAVPLKLTPYVEHDKNSVTQFQRATVGEIYAQIVKDLLEAEGYLTESPQNDDHRLHRASAEAVDLLLSRVYLYMQDYENAEKKADAVIASSNCSMTRLNMLSEENIFLAENSTEVIFSQGSNFMAPEDVLTGGGADFCVSMDLYKLYDEEKDRRAKVFFVKSAESDSIGLFRKYKKATGVQSHISDAFTLRSTEAYLNKAEACAMQSGKESVANSLLNEIRVNRIDDYETQTYSGSELVSEIRVERRKELCFEGHRWFDLRRYAVCEKYPYSRDIVHVTNAHDDNNKNRYLATVRYLLPAGDPAYTFQIPKKVLEFDEVPMPENPREPRPAIKDK